jgi:thiosulfate/3-mercaptopyruvate sulfurtransferase
MMRNSAGGALFASVLLAVAVLSAAAGRAQFSDPASAPASSAFSIPQDHVMPPETLNKMLQGGGAKPLVLQVGSHVMFSQAHIRGAQYAGRGVQPAGLQVLESKVEGLRKNAFVVIYCGCCPWNRCPNVGPAFHRLVELGFINVKVLYLANNFGDDWVNRGYSVETGE